MKNIVVRYGVIASLIVVGVPLLSGLIIGFGMDSFAMGEIVGYTSMIVAMTTVYFAMRHYRDQINKGVLSFGLGLKIGSLVSVLAGIAFAIYNVVFVTFIMPDFNEQYFAYAEGLELGTPEFEAKFTAMMEANGFMFSVLGGTILMFSTVFLIGFIMSLISSLILQRKQVMAV
ncbi:DUF4199 domain-containing protein [Roseivirga echinicomitans]|uniref:DUF4199 domain-containing protein n=1 Tax=Roseivirga echinicomitans TaxID=296218 RepID=A0A150XJJ2_9BACT|nr:DUF4199 domain-containing protein [Roseivirga echinicomitans]KYG78908.1 hypothetical protein AWN68_04580 [Roseivirga echinicomitans]